MPRRGCRRSARRMERDPPRREPNGEASGWKEKMLFLVGGKVAVYIYIYILFLGTLEDVFFWEYSAG